MLEYPKNNFMTKVKTKIIATIGPATLDYHVFEKLVHEGIDFVRINTSYGDENQYDIILENLKRADPKKRIQVIYDIKKLETLNYFLKNNLKFIALSFAHSKRQIKEVKKRAPHCFLISKIETRKGVRLFESILEASDGIMIARGDLGKAVSLEKLPPIQKKLTIETLKTDKFLITATEMMLHMVHYDRPTRAEASDVANAVFDGSNAVMLSEETAIGKYPIETVRYMRKIIHEAEKWKKSNQITTK